MPSDVQVPRDGLGLAGVTSCPVLSWSSREDPRHTLCGRGSWPKRWVQVWEEMQEDQAQ